MIRTYYATYFRSSKLLLRYLSSTTQSSKVNEIAKPNKTSVAIKNLFDRCLLATTFPDTLSSDFTDFDALPSVVYAGFDPTSPSLHIGNLLIVNNLLHLYASGFDVVVLLGGATCKLGDPSDKSTDRPPLEWSTITENNASLLTQLQSLFSNFTDHIYKGDRSQLKPVKFINNARWYANLNVITFMSDYGRHFRVGHLLEKAVVRRRLTETGMNMNEFVYQMFQAYDFLRIYEEFGCRIQLGGSDQVGNVHSGHDLIQKIHQTNAVGIFAPLLTSDDGEKLGKSLGNAVTLNPKTTSVFELYQHFLQLPDVQMRKYLYLFSFLPLNQIDDLFERHMRKPENRMAQKTLAEHVTLLVHGKDGLQSALRSTDALFSNKIETVVGLSKEEIENTFKNVPTVELQYRNDVTLLELVTKTNLFETEKAYIYWIEKGAFYVNLIRIQDPYCVMVKGTHVLPNDVTLLRYGKKNTVLVKWFR